MLSELHNHAVNPHTIILQQLQVHYQLNMMGVFCSSALCAHSLIGKIHSLRGKTKQVLGYLSALFLLACISATVTVSAADSGSDQAALWSFASAVAPGNSMNWNLSVNPCKWRGVQCVNSRVVTIRLPAAGLSGQIPQQSMGNLSELRILSLESNALSGPLPDDLTKCSKLRRLFLQNNNLSGSLPEDFSFWPFLSRVNLANNSFSGSIPSSLGNITGLETLYLQNNRLSGPLPDLSGIQSLVQFNVAYNNLSGPVPKGMVTRFSAEDFIGNHICGPPLAFPCGPVAAPPRHGSHGLSAGAITAIVISGVLALVIVLFLLVRFCGGMKLRSDAKDKKWVDSGAVSKTNSAFKDESSFSMSAVEGEKLEQSRLVFLNGADYSFNIEDLLRASAEVLGKGSTGTAYKAGVGDGVVVVVKRLKDVSITRREFEAHIEAVGRLQHPNLLPLRAYYFSGDEKLLVYDYLPMGSLSALLHGSSSAGLTPLDWPKRCMVALGTARGLVYLHEQGGKAGQLVHGNIKSSNVLLNEELEPRVSDLGLLRILSSSASASPVVGYRAPEVAETKRETQKSDVYSYGVLLLELLTGKAPTQASLNQQGIDLPRWVQSVVREEWTAEVFDMELMKNVNREEELVQMLQIALACVATFPDQRPNMKQVLEMIQDVRQVHSDSVYRQSEDRSVEIS